MTPNVAKSVEGVGKISGLFKVEYESSEKKEGGLFSSSYINLKLWTIVFIAIL
jgi:hypothetical protein